MTEEEYNTVKIASFRITKGLWAEFCTKAEGQRLTATDVLKVAIERFLNGEFDMSTHGGTAVFPSQLPPQADIQELVNTAVSTASLPILARLQAIEQRPPMDIGYVLNQLRGMAERIGAIEQTLATVPARPPTAPQAKEPGELGDEDRKWVRRFEAEPELRAAAAAAIAQGGTSKEIADRLLEAGHGNTKGAAFDATVVSRMKKAIAYMNG
jgi:hypothetical protein